MNGFEIFLCVLAGIILFFVLILSIPFHISITYTDKVYLSVRYGFIKLNILPLGPKKEKKPKKEKPKKEKKEKEEKPKEEKPKKEKKPSPILAMVKANGYDGIMEVISNLGAVLGKFNGNLFRSVVFDEVEIYATIGTGDAASTALKYGEACQKIFPFAGFICSNNLVKKYDLYVNPDFLANKSEVEMNLDFYMVIRKIINAFFGLVFRLIFKVGLKFIMNGKSKDKDKAEQPAEKAVKQ